MNKLQTLRDWFKLKNLHGFVLPSTDEFQGEYVPAYARRLEWLTGFSGSAGMAIILREKAAFFTDGRYTLQARRQVQGFTLHNTAEVKPHDWLKENAAKGCAIGYDARLFSKNTLRHFEKAAEQSGLRLLAVANPIDELWKDRPQTPNSPIFIHDLKYSGESSAFKRKRVAREIKNHSADCTVLTAPDSVCWLLNIRGNDVPHTPFVLANAVLHSDETVDLFVDPARVGAVARKHLGRAVRIIEPGHLQPALEMLAAKRVLVDPAASSTWFFQVLERAKAKIVTGEDPCQLPKAVKNAVELEGARKAHIFDGVALVKFLYWLDAAIRRGRITEITAAEKLRVFRAENECFQDVSFDTICGFGANGAIVHYRADEKTSRRIKGRGILLLDSGAQYLEGTTDVTRTIAIGKPSKEQKRHFTLVLKGHIALARAVFARGTSGSQIDVLARQHLWQAGLDYDHGTGHGVGSYLSVHEGPQRISKVPNSVALQPGMVLSNEPGYYREGKYGIRIESLVAVRPWKKEGFYCFETLTRVPIDRRLIDVSMLTREEKEWLNRYHAMVKRVLAPKLDKKTAAWLRQKTRAL